MSLKHVKYIIDRTMGTHLVSKGGTRDSVDDGRAPRAQFSALDVSQRRLQLFLCVGASASNGAAEARIRPAGQQICYKTQKAAMPQKRLRKPRVEITKKIPYCFNVDFFSFLNFLSTLMFLWLNASQFR
jgi:hypothetical protein